MFAKCVDMYMCVVYVFCICVLYMCVRVSNLSLFLQLYDTILELSDIGILSLLQHRFVSTRNIDVEIDIIYNTWMGNCQI